MSMAKARKPINTGIDKATRMSVCPFSSFRIFIATPERQLTLSALCVSKSAAQPNFISAGGHLDLEPSRTVISERSPESPYLLLPLLPPPRTPVRGLLSRSRSRRSHRSRSRLDDRRRRNTFPPLHQAGRRMVERHRRPVGPTLDRRRSPIHRGAGHRAKAPAPR